MKVLSKFWLKLSWLFDPVQYLFNGNFWEVFQYRFRRYTHGKVLDLACGTGELRRYINPVSYWGVDINESYIDYARISFSQKNTHFIANDITKVVLTEQVDTAFLISAVHHLTDQQLRSTFQNIKKQRVKNVVVIDGFPKSVFTPLLSWLDATLAGGKYFKSEQEISQIASRYFQIKEKGCFTAKRSFYVYPYIIAVSSGQSTPGQAQKARQTS